MYSMLDTGALAPHFTLLGIDGREYCVPSDSAGAPLVVVFLKTGCAACDIAMPYLKNLHGAYPAGWRMWAVIQEPPDKAREYARKHGATFPFLIDAPGYEVSRLYDPPSTPAIFFVEPQGRVSFATNGFSKDDLNAVASRVAAAIGAEPRIVAPPGDGQPDFRPGCVPRHLMPARPRR